MLRTTLPTDREAAVGVISGKQEFYVKSNGHYWRSFSCDRSRNHFARGIDRLRRIHFVRDQIVDNTRLRRSIRHRWIHDLSRLAKQPSGELIEQFRLSNP